MTHRDMLQGPADKQAEIEHTLDDYERELLQAIEEGQLRPRQARSRTKPPWRRQPARHWRNRSA